MKGLLSQNRSNKLQIAESPDTSFHINNNDSFMHEKSSFESKINFNQENNNMGIVFAINNINEEGDYRPKVLIDPTEA